MKALEDAGLLINLGTRLDSKPTKTDWNLWSRDLDARIGPL